MDNKTWFQATIYSNIHFLVRLWKSLLIIYPKRTPKPKHLICYAKHEYTTGERKTRQRRKKTKHKWSKNLTLFGQNYKLLAYEIWYWFVATSSYLFGTLLRHFVTLSSLRAGASFFFSLSGVSIVQVHQFCWKWFWEFVGGFIHCASRLCLYE